MCSGFICRGDMRKHSRKSLPQRIRGCNLTRSRIRRRDDRQRKTLAKRVFPDTLLKASISYLVLLCSAQPFACSIRDVALRSQAARAGWRKSAFFCQAFSATMCPSVPHCRWEMHLFLFSFGFSESSLFWKAQRDSLRKLPVQIWGILAEGTFPASPTLVVLEMGKRLAMETLWLQWFSRLKQSILISKVVTSHSKTFHMQKGNNQRIDRLINWSKDSSVIREKDLISSTRKITSGKSKAQKTDPSQADLGKQWLKNHVQRTPMSIQKNGQKIKQTKCSDTVIHTYVCIILWKAHIPVFFSYLKR